MLNAMECQPKARLSEGKDSSQEDNEIQQVSSKYGKFVEKQESDELQENKAPAELCVCFVPF